MPVVLVRHFNVTEEQRSITNARPIAPRDILTKLPKHYLFADRFDQALSNWTVSGTAFAVLLFDLDHFKEINDKHGHEVGDQVLKASRQIACFRSLVFP